MTEFPSPSLNPMLTLEWQHTKRYPLQSACTIIKLVCQVGTLHAQLIWFRFQLVCPPVTPQTKLYILPTSGNDPKVTKKFLHCSPITLFLI